MGRSIYGQHSQQTSSEEWKGYLHAQNMRVNIAQITLIFFSSNFSRVILQPVITEPVPVVPLVKLCTVIAAERKKARGLGRVEERREAWGESRKEPNGPIFLSSFFRPDPNLHLVLSPPLLHLHYLPGLGLESIKKSSSSWLTFSGSS